jgi:hypothetical protein
VFCKLIIIAIFAHKETRGVELLVDYNHTCNLGKILAYFIKKTMDKEVVKKIREHKCKENKEKRVRQMVGSMTMVEISYQKLVDKHARTNLYFVWFVTTIMDVGNKFHYNFQVGFRVHVLGYKGVNLKVTSIVRKESKVKAMVRMKTK